MSTGKSRNSRATPMQDWRAQQPLVADGRSQTGQIIILENMFNHIHGVQKMKSEVDARLTPVKVYPKRRPLVDQFIEVREAARRSNFVKPSVDNSQPHTYDMKDKISKFHTANRKEQFESVEHYNRVHHMQRRIVNSNNLVERRKNPFDATIYPSLKKRIEDEKATEDPTEVIHIMGRKRITQGSVIPIDPMSRSGSEIDLSQIQSQGKTRSSTVMEFNRTNKSSRYADSQ